MSLVAPLPAVAARRRSQLWGVPVYWHLLSLDAPTVAVLWAWSLARAAEVHVSSVSIGVLGVGTWLIYVADRLLDVRAGEHSALRERHYFHARHRRQLLLVAPAAVGILLGLVWFMPADARRDDTILFAISMLYFGGVHLPDLRMRRWFPREVAVGTLFALATAVPAWSAAGSPHVLLATLVLLFAGLCTLNCIAIETWESGEAIRSVTVPAIAVCVGLMAVAMLVVPGIAAGGAVGLCLASVTSAGVLFVLDRLCRESERGRAGREDRARFLLVVRISADAALLTPILFLLPWHL